MTKVEEKIIYISSFLENAWKSLDGVCASNSEIITLINSLYFNSVKEFKNMDDYMGLIGKHLYSKSSLGGLDINKIICVGRFLAYDDMTYNDGLFVRNDSYYNDLIGRSTKIGNQNQIDSAIFIPFNEIGVKYFYTREEAEKHFFKTPHKLQFKKLVVYREDIRQNRRKRDYSGYNVIGLHKYDPEIRSYRRIEKYSKSDILNYIRNKEKVMITISPDAKENLAVYEYGVCPEYEVFLEYELIELEEVNE